MNNNLPQSRRRTPVRSASVNVGVTLATNHLLRPLMTGRDRFVFAVFVGLWLMLLGEFWLWWLRLEHIIDPARMILNTLLVMWATLVPAYFFVVMSRARVPDAALPLPPNQRIAMVVTKAPSEPAAIVQETLRAMLAQGYPHDTWLADEDPTPEMIDWCERHGVKISTRKGVPDYHRAEWPRRTKCKEGNLAYFYDTYGYRNYDFVAQLDADHVPRRGYLEAMLRPFLDPRVGYVSAPSMCGANAEQSWSARGRLQFEASMHGALQAGYTGGFAPLCIGSHYAVRTAALQDIGGLGPELAEDHSTTLLMNAGGWRGVHAFDAEAHGDGPSTFADMIVQEFQWARSLVTILLRYTPTYFRDLPGPIKLQFLFCQLWYVFYSLSLLATAALPIVALLTGKPWVGITYIEFFLRTTLLMGVLWAVLFWLRCRGWLRPSTRVFSWEGMLFVFARWPWTLLGVIMAVADFLRGQTSEYRITPKGDRESAPLPFRVIAPYLAISLLSGVTALLISRPGSAIGFYAFAIVNCLLYLLLTITIVVRHTVERGRTSIADVLSSFVPAPRLIGVGLTASVLLIAGTLRLPDSVAGVLWGSGLVANGERSIAEMVGGPDTPQLGVYDWRETFGGENYVAIEHEFVSWLDDPTDTLQVLATYSRERDRWPLVTVEPWSNRHNGSLSLLQATATGLYDAEIARTCGALAAMDMPVFVRWGHEMEVPTGRYPWADVDAGAYVDAYRRFVDACRLENAEFYFVWSPRGDGQHLHLYYPGSDYVDQVGLSLYSHAGYDLQHHGRVRTFADAFAERYAGVEFYGKPVMIAELGVDGSSDHRRSWLTRGIEALEKFTLVESVVYFNAPDSPEAWGPGWPVPDWSIDPHVFTTGSDQPTLELALGELPGPSGH